MDSLAHSRISEVIKNGLLLTVLPITLLTACGKQDADNAEASSNKAEVSQGEAIVDIELIQNGIMDFNKTTTVGQAINNWSECGTSAWHSFKTSSGVRVVQFDCGAPALVDLASKLHDSTNCNSDEMKCRDIDVVGHRTVLQWTMNIDGSDSFQVDKATTIMNRS